MWDSDTLRSVWLGPRYTGNTSLTVTLPLSRWLFCVSFRLSVSSLLSQHFFPLSLIPHLWKEAGRWGSRTPGKPPSAQASVSPAAFQGFTTCDFPWFSFLVFFFFTFVPWSLEMCWALPFLLKSLPGLGPCLGTSEISLFKWPPPVPRPRSCCVAGLRAFQWSSVPGPPSQRRGIWQYRHLRSVPSSFMTTGKKLHFSEPLSPPL